MDTENDSVDQKRKADAAIKAQFDILKKSEGALTVIGSLMARAACDGVYTDPPKQIAEHCYGLRAAAGKSSASQISKLSNFAHVALAWDRHGIELVEELVKLTSGMSPRYRTVQLVLVMLKKRRRAGAVMPEGSELAEMLAVAQAPKQPKSRKSAGNNLVQGIDALLQKNTDMPKDIVTACGQVKSYVQKKTAEFCS